MLFQPSQEVSPEDGIWENIWSNMCTAVFDLVLLKQWKMEKKLEELPSSASDPTQKAIYRTSVLRFRGDGNLALQQGLEYAFVCM